MESSGSVAQVIEPRRQPILRRWLRAAIWLLLGSAIFFVIAYVHTAIFGREKVQAAIRAETTAEYKSLKVRAPVAVHPSFGGPNFQVCRAVFPGLIRCNYTVLYGGKAGGEYEGLYFWNGWKCERLRHTTLVLCIEYVGSVAGARPNYTLTLYKSATE